MIIDAMGTQRKICQKIVLRSGDYVGALKSNQQSLFTDVQDYFEGLSDPEERHTFVLRDVTFL